MNYYEIGAGRDAEGLPIEVGYLPPGPDTSPDGLISVSIGEGPGSQGGAIPPKKMLEFRYGRLVWKEVDGKLRFQGEVKEAPGWFERFCRQANCEWFVPVVKRMAAGENVPLQEIQSTYLAHNGKPIPHKE